MTMNNEKDEEYHTRASLHARAQCTSTTGIILVDTK